MTFDEALRKIAETLAANPVIASRGVARTESEQLLTSAVLSETGAPLRRVTLYAQGREEVPKAALARAFEMATARARGELLQHLTGFQTFLSHDYQVTPDVLVPRPETELLVTMMTERLTPP